MITVQAKDTGSPLSLGVDTKSSKSDTGSFAALLHSLGSQTQAKSTENGALMLHLNDKKESQTIKSSTKDIKNSAIKDLKKQPEKSQLLSLLKGEESKSTPSINPDLLQNVDAKALKSIMKDAKNYLKEQIQSTDAYKKGEIKELPKTLQGLVEVAKKVGIEISKITVETVQQKNAKTTNDLKTTTAEIKKDSHPVENVKTQTPLTQTLQTKTNDPKTEKLQTTLQDEKKAPIQNIQAAPKNVQTPETSEPKITKSETHKEQKTAHTKSDTQTSQQTPLEQKHQTLNETPAVEEKNLHSEELLALNEKIDTQKQMPKQESSLTAALTSEQSIKSMPLFTVPQTLATHSTAEIVGTKQTKTKEEQPTSKAPSLLSALLHGDKAADTKAAVSTDTKIKTPSSVLSELLHGENAQVLSSTEQMSSTSKTEDLSQNSENSLHVDGASHVKQAESDLSVKMNEAKQMTKYLAQDIKQAIEDYKAPFTRIKVKLNPEKLGEVDLTVIQRGKNIHVNISSNNSAIASLAQNVNDLKVQLTQNGMNNATLNFNSSTDTQSQQQQQQQRHNEQQKEGAKRAYEAFNQDGTTSEEVLSSLEIVLPQYI